MLIVHVLVQMTMLNDGERNWRCSHSVRGSVDLIVVARPRINLGMLLGNPSCLVLHLFEFGNY